MPTNFRDLRTAQNEGDGFVPLEKQELAFRDEQLADQAAFKIVHQAVVSGEQYLNSKSMPQEWDRMDDLYRAYVAVKPWPGSNNPRSALPMPIILEAIETLMPQIVMAFFSDPQPFLLNPKGKTRPLAARAMAKVLNWALKCAEFQEEFRVGVKNALAYGNIVLKYGWQSVTHTERVFKKGPDGKIQYEEKQRTISHPSAEAIEPRFLIVDGSCRRHDIRHAGFVVHQRYINANDLDDLRDDPTYKNIPTRAELKEILTPPAEPATESVSGSKMQTYRENQAEWPNKATSPDPLKQPLEILEYTDADRVVTVLQRCIVIRNDDNDFGELNYRSCAFIDVMGAYLGFGVGKMLEGEQRFQTGVVNKWVDGLAITLDPMWHRKKGNGPQSQAIMSAPGKVVNDDGELEPLKMPDSKTQEALEAISTSEARAQRRVGANAGNEMPTQAMRTAEGVQNFTAGMQIRLQYFVEFLANLVFIPILQAFIELIKTRLQHDEINTILTEEEGKAYEEDILDVYNGQYELEVLSSTKLAARRAMAALVPNLVQLLGSPAFVPAMAAAGVKPNFAAIFEDMINLTGFDADEWIVPMTPEDMQRVAQSNPAIVKQQMDAQHQMRQHQMDTDLENTKIDGRATVQALRTLLKLVEGNSQELAGLEQQVEGKPPAAPLANQPPQPQNP